MKRARRIVSAMRFRLLPALAAAVPVAGCAAEGSFGLRAGVLLPRSGEFRDYEANPVLGACLGLLPGDEARTCWELGIDVGLREESGRFSSVPVAGRIDAVFLFGADLARTRPYLLAGGSGHVEFVEGLTSGQEYTNYAAGIDLGAGTALASGKFDLRVAHTVLFGSENLGAQTVASVAYFF